MLVLVLVLLSISITATEIAALGLCHSFFQTIPESSDSRLISEILTVEK